MDTLDSIQILCSRRGTSYRSEEMSLRRRLAVQTSDQKIYAELTNKTWKNQGKNWRKTRTDSHNEDIK